MVKDRDIYREVFDIFDSVIDILTEYGVEHVCVNIIVSFGMIQFRFILYC